MKAAVKLAPKQLSCLAAKKQKYDYFPAVFHVQALKSTSVEVRSNSLLNHQILRICEVFNSTLCEFAMAEFADNGSLTNILAEGETKAKKRKRSIQAIRKKRIKRNLAKKEEHKKMTKQERRKKLTLGLQDKVNDLQRKLDSSKHLYKKEKRISAYCWRKWKEYIRVAVQTQRCRNCDHMPCSFLLFTLINWSSLNVVVESEVLFSSLRLNLLFSRTINLFAWQQSFCICIYVYAMYVGITSCFW